MVCLPYFALSDLTLLLTDSLQYSFHSLCGSGAPRGVSWLPRNPPKSVKKTKYCIVINFEKRGRESYIDVYVIPSLSSKFITIQYSSFTQKITQHTSLSAQSTSEREERERERERD